MMSTMAVTAPAKTARMLRRKLPCFRIGLELVIVEPLLPETAGAPRAAAVWDDEAVQQCKEVLEDINPLYLRTAGQRGCPVWRSGGSAAAGDLDSRSDEAWQAKREWQMDHIRSMVRMPSKSRPT